MSKHFDAIVIGIGAMGSATLYQLAKRGWNALGIEQFDVPHDMGSSHGLTRIIRLAYYEDPSYVPLLRRSYELWDELEGEASERLFYQTGSIDMGPEDSDVFAGSLKSCLEHDLEHEVLNSAQLTRRFPGLSPARRDYGGVPTARRSAGAGALHCRLRSPGSCARRDLANGRARDRLGNPAQRTRTSAYRPRVLQRRQTRHLWRRLGIQAFAGSGGQSRSRTASIDLDAR